MSPRIVPSVTPAEARARTNPASTSTSSCSSSSADAGGRCSRKSRTAASDNSSPSPSLRPLKGRTRRGLFTNSEAASNGRGSPAREKPDCSEPRGVAEHQRTQVMSDSSAPAPSGRTAADRLDLGPPPPRLSDEHDLRRRDFPSNRAAARPAGEPAGPGWMASPALPPLGWAIAHDPAGQFVANGADHRTIGGSWRSRRRLPSPAPTKGTDAPRPRPTRRRRVAAGDRVELVSTSDPYRRLRPGDRGTVTGIGHIPWRPARSPGPPRLGQRQHAGDAARRGRPALQAHRRSSGRRLMRHHLAGCGLQPRRRPQATAAPWESV
jgi:hypothetical protein